MCITKINKNTLVLKETNIIYIIYFIDLFYEIYIIILNSLYCTSTIQFFSYILRYEFLEATEAL